MEWEWAMEEIAKRVKESRDKSFTEKNDKGQLVDPHRSHGFVRFRRNGQRGVLGLSVHLLCAAFSAWCYIEHQARL